MENINTPLAHFLKPTKIEDIIGQDHIIGNDSFLKRAIENNNIPSMIFYGPSGTGKTSLALVISKIMNTKFEKVNAVSAGISDLREIIKQALINKKSLFNKKTILFIDEIHRFNKKQQDYLLPFVENGTITLIGATTENPSFEVNSALLSRTQVFVFKTLTKEHIFEILKKSQEKILSLKVISEKNKINEPILIFIAFYSHGDARFALNIYELAIQEKINGQKITQKTIKNIIQNKALMYDKNGSQHYNIISALHKSMRDSDPHAAAYWTMRMIEGGEDPKYIVRRMMRFASEDIGNANPQALILASATQNTVNFLGLPECNTALVQLATYLALSEKDNSCYVAVCDIKEDIKKYGPLDVPVHLKNAVTDLDKKMGYGKGIKYAHNFKDKKVEQIHLPKELQNKKYYKNSFERKKEGKKDLW